MFTVKGYTQISRAFYVRENNKIEKFYWIYSVWCAIFCSCSMHISSPTYQEQTSLTTKHTFWPHLQPFLWYRPFFYPVQSKQAKISSKTQNIILTFYSLHDLFQDASENDNLYFVFSIFCSPSYIGHTSYIDKRRTSHTSCSLNIKHTSFLYYKLHAIGAEHFTFCTLKSPHSPGKIPYWAV